MFPWFSVLTSVVDKSLGADSNILSPFPTHSQSRSSTPCNVEPMCSEYFSQVNIVLGEVVGNRIIIIPFEQRVAFLSWRLKFKAVSQALLSSVVVPGLSAILTVIRGSGRWVVMRRSPCGYRCFSLAWAKATILILLGKTPRPFN